jgi:Uma2 family endonuclease
MKGIATMATTERYSMVIPADWVPGPQQGEWTYSQYAALHDDGQRYEIVNGVLVMPPSPSGPHQDAVGEIFSYLRTHVKLAGLGLVRLAPFDVELSPKDVFQPDIFVVLNAHLDKVTDKKVIGPPDLVVEVLSPGTSVFDRFVKYDTYARAGVPEYWIVYPDRRAVEVLVLEGDKYHSLGLFCGQQTLPSQIVPDLPVYVEQFFL